MLPTCGIPVGEGANLVIVGFMFEIIFVLRLKLYHRITLSRQFLPMQTLTNAASSARQGLKWVGVGVVGLFFLIILFMVVRAGYRTIFPPKPLPATVAFGKLPQLDFSEGVTPQDKINFRLETVSGEFPSLPPRAKVFKIAGGDTTFGRIENIKSISAKLNFNPNPTGVTGNIYNFVGARDASRKLSVDISTLNFELDSPFNTPDLIDSAAPSVGSATQRVYTLFKTFGLREVDFPKADSKTNLFRIDGQFLSETPAIGSANLVQVNLVRAEIDKLPIISPRSDIFPASALVSKRDVVSAKLFMQDVEFSKFSTYPLKNIGTAYDELVNGGGAFIDEVDSSAFEVREIKLGYLENTGKMEYLQPIYMFIDSKGVIGYVGAVGDSWIKN